MKKYIFFFILLFCGMNLLFAYSAFCHEPLQKLSLGKITDIKSISIRLAWSDKFKAAQAEKFSFIKTAHAKLPPQYQPHYLHELIFHHSNKKITDTFKSFIGFDQSQMQSSTVTWNHEVYDKLKDFIEEKAVICLAKKRKPQDGPDRATIYFNKNDSSKIFAYFSGVSHHTTTDSYELCSPEFVQYLKSLESYKKRNPNPEFKP